MWRWLNGSGADLRLGPVEFDSLLLMKAGGRVVYFGKIEKLATYFESEGVSLTRVSGIGAQCSQLTIHISLPGHDSKGRQPCRVHDRVRGLLVYVQSNHADLS